MKSYDFRSFVHEVNFHNCEFICSTRNTRNGFAHDAHLIVDGASWDNFDATCNYYNRTWERYEYQTVMRRLVSNEISLCVSYHLEDFKRDRGYQRMNAKRRAEFAEWIERNCDDALMTFVCLYEAIENDGIMPAPYPDWYGYRPKTFNVSDFIS